MGFGIDGIVFMRDRQEKIALVIPCFNEEIRLSSFDSARIPSGCHLLFVNDGSSDRTGAIMAQWEHPQISWFRLSKNSGKAEAVRRGMLHLATLPVFPTLEWVGYWDADFSTPLEELDGMLSYWELNGRTAVSLCGSRVLKLGSDIQRSWVRHVLGRLFASAVGWTFPDLKVYDSQCGAKVFRKELHSLLFEDPFISRWIFDVEILLRLRGRPALEYPLRFWRDKSGSKFRLLRDGTKTLRDLIRIRRHYR